MVENIKILFLAADPSDQTRTRLAGEYQTIKDELERGPYGHRFLLRAQFSVKIEDMTRAVKGFQPHIIHFSGHGSVNGDLCCEDAMAKAKRFKIKNLDGIFARAAGQAVCVVLNACYSAKQAAIISRYIPYVIGLKEVVTEPAARCFSLGFYQSLSAGEAIEGAFKDACALLEAHELLDSVKPVLKVGKGAEKPLVGRGGALDSGSAELLSAIRGASENRNKANGRSFGQPQRPPTAVTVRNTRSGRDTYIEASPGTVDARQVVAGRDLAVKAKRSESD